MSQVKNRSLLQVQYGPSRDEHRGDMYNSFHVVKRRWKVGLESQGELRDIVGGAQPTILEEFAGVAGSNIFNHTID